MFQNFRLIRREARKKAGRPQESEHGAMPLEVGGALRFRLEAEGKIVDFRLQIADVRRHRGWG